MQIVGLPKAFLRKEALEYIDLYRSLGERAEVFLPNYVFDNLQAFVRLCYEEPIDPARQQAEIQNYLLKFQEELPVYSDLALMLYPHEDSKAFYTLHLNRNSIKSWVTLPITMWWARKRRPGLKTYLP